MNLYISNDPESSLPLYVTKSEEVIVGIGVCHYANGITHGNIVVELFAIIQSASVAEDVTVVFVLYDDVLPHSRRRFYSFTISDCTIELCHF